MKATLMASSNIRQAEKQITSISKLPAVQREEI